MLSRPCQSCQEKDALFLTENPIAIQQYNSSHKPITWQSCDIYADLALSVFSSKSSMRQQSRATVVSSEMPRWLEANGRRGMMECNDSTPAQTTIEMGKGSSHTLTSISCHTVDTRIQRRQFNIGAPLSLSIYKLLILTAAYLHVCLKWVHVQVRLQQTFLTGIYSYLDWPCSLGQWRDSWWR